MDMSRRKLLTGLTAFVATAPAVIRTSGLLMPTRAEAATLYFRAGALVPEWMMNVTGAAARFGQDATVLRSPTRNRVLGRAFEIPLIDVSSYGHGAINVVTPTSLHFEVRPGRHAPDWRIRRELY